jgi:predicted NUDIX family NTP pyrophosphohydrolase
MPKVSAGLLVYRRRNRRLEVYLVHPGGPFWAKKDAGAWSIPKGEVPPGSDALAHARIELQEETGCAVDGEFTPLKPVRQAGGKTVQAWAIEGDCDADNIVSNTFTVEWPPRSGKMQEFPEVDRAGWFDLDTARAKLIPAQGAFLDQLQELLSGDQV